MKLSVVSHSFVSRNPKENFNKAQHLQYKKFIAEKCQPI